MANWDKMQESGRDVGHAAMAGGLAVDVATSVGTRGMICSLIWTTDWQPV